MLTANLILERLSREKRLLERQEQPSRSFVKGFLGLLYVGHAHLGSGSPYSQKDIRGNSRASDVNERGVPLLIASPPGWTDYMSNTRYDSAVHISAELVGIQLGTGTTPPAPTDYALENRIPHSDHIPETVSSRGEYYLTQVTPGEEEVYGTRWIAIQFTALWAHTIYSARLRMYREGLPGTVTISIRSSLTGADLCSATLDGDTLTTDTAGEWREITFSTQAELGFLGEYYIVVRATGGDTSNSVHLIADADEVYPGGVNYYSTNGGGSWSRHSGYSYSYLCLFEEFGRDLSRGILYGGCEVFGLSFSGPNGQFTIRRFFANASGDSWTVHEVAIYAMGTHHSGQCWSFMIARDIVSPGITVADGELLAVTYVPQITV